MYYLVCQMVRSARGIYNGGKTRGRLEVVT